MWDMPRFRILPISHGQHRSTESTHRDRNDPRLGVNRVPIHYTGFVKRNTTIL
jgi:hypothetical protein